MFVFGLLIIKHSIVFPMSLSLIILNLIFGYGKTMFRIMPAFLFLALLTYLIVSIYSNQTNSLQAGLRIILLGISIIPTISMPSIDLVRSLNAINCPRWLTLSLLIALRFSPIMGKEILRIRQAIKLRGANAAWYNPTIWYRSLIIPLMVRIISISDLLSVSLETRAFTMHGSSTQYKRINIKLRDVAYLSIIVFICVSSLILSKSIDSEEILHGLY